LPWQSPRDPYRVWVSEIMLQQTRVATVIPCFERFIARFPDVHSLARADADEVLHLWSGLGYYARARRLHQAARLLSEQHGGRVPGSLQALLQLPGIGRSTAGAILALGYARRQPILDGNGKRVLTRYHGIREWPGQAATERRLWQLAEQHTPARRVAAYTQAIMDLGATVCLPRRPACACCPLQRGCRARRDGLQHELPAAGPRRRLPQRRTRFIIAREPGGLLLMERRPPVGIWGGLWCFPECATERDVADWAQQELGRRPRRRRRLPTFEHVFSHFRLRIEPVLLEFAPDTGADHVAEAGSRRWLRDPVAQRIGLAAPTRRLLAIIAADLTHTENQP